MCVFVCACASAEEAARPEGEWDEEQADPPQREDRVWTRGAERPPLPTKVCFQVHPSLQALQSHVSAHIWEYEPTHLLS